PPRPGPKRSEADLAVHVGVEEAVRRGAGEEEEPGRPLVAAGAGEHLLERRAEAARAIALQAPGAGLAHGERAAVLEGVDEDAARLAAAGRGRRRRRESVEAEEGRGVERAEGHSRGAEAEGAGAAVGRRGVDDDVPLLAAARAIALIVVAFVGD